MAILNKIKYHTKTKKFCKIMRQVAKHTTVQNSGYIVDFSDDFVVLQETHDFKIEGYVVFPVQIISEVRNNANDKYLDKIMHWEGSKDKVGNKHKIDLTSWKTVLKSIQKLGFNVIIENETPNNQSFDIGQIKKVTKSAVHIRYFSATGVWEKDTTKIGWDLITIVKFDDSYTNIFSKYLREAKK